MEKKSFLLRARIDMEKAREHAGEAVGDKSAESSELDPRIATLAKFDDAVRTYINCTCPYDLPLLASIAAGRRLTAN